MSTALYTCAPADLASLLSCPDSCPAFPLRGCNSLASCSRNSSLLPARFFPAQVDFPERCEGSGYAVQFILKSRAFLLEFADHRLHQAFWHAGILSSAFGRQGRSPGKLYSFSITTNLGAALTGVIHLRGYYDLRGFCYTRTPHHGTWNPGARGAREWGGEYGGTFSRGCHLVIMSGHGTSTGCGEKSP